MISQFFILSPRGDVIINRDFRGDLIRGTNEIFFRHVKLNKSDTTPVFNIDGINYLYLKRSNLYIAGTTRFNVSPSLMLDTLLRLYKVIKDYCGVFTEESIRKNFILVYEIIDEMIDFGHIQSISTEQVRNFIVNEPISVENSPSSFFRPGIISPNTLPPTAIRRTISAKSKNEIFVDIFEKISYLFNSNGYSLNSSIEGCIQMKSYLHGNPQLRLCLNEDLVIGRGKGQYGSVVLDDCNFHECVDTREFDDFKVLTINPPDGEFVVMNYRINGDYDAPFRVFAYIDEHTPYRVQFQIKVKATIPEKNYGANVAVKCNLPKSTTSAAIELPKKLSGQNTEYRRKDKSVVWTITKFNGGMEYGINVTLSLSQPVSAREIGPVALDFEIPMFNLSNLQVKYLRIADNSTNFYRWVRYVTQSSSYVCRI